MFLAENVEVPEPTLLYTAVKVWDPGVRPVTSAVALARTGSLLNTRSEFPSEAEATLPSTWNDMKLPVLPVLANACAVTITSTCAPVVTVTDGPALVPPPGTFRGP